MKYCMILAGCILLLQADGWAQCIDAAAWKRHRDSMNNEWEKMVKMVKNDSTLSDSEKKEFTGDAAWMDFFSLCHEHSRRLWSGVAKPDTFYVKPRTVY